MPDPGSLDHLNDIVTPEAVSWWPPQPGWWVLAGVVLALAAWWAARTIHRHRAVAWRREALAELDRMAGALAGGAEPVAAVAGLPTLLRRCALAVFGREKGIKKRRALDMDEPFSALLDDLAYRPAVEMDRRTAERLLGEARDRVRRLERRKEC